MVDGCRIRELPDGGRQFILDEPELTFLRIDHHVSLQFGPTELVIETPFEVDVDDRIHRLDPRQATTLGPLLAFYPGTVEWLWTNVDGELTVAFHGGGSVVVRPDPVARAWSVGSVHCLPGGRG